MQAYRSSRSVQIPPLKQGLLRHSLISAPHNSPIQQWNHVQGTGRKEWNSVISREWIQRNTEYMLYYTTTYWQRLDMTDHRKHFPLLTFWTHTFKGVWTESLLPTQGTWVLKLRWKHINNLHSTVIMEHISVAKDNTHKYTTLMITHVQVGHDPPVNVWTPTRVPRVTATSGHPTTDPCSQLRRHKWTSDH